MQCRKPHRRALRKHGLMQAMETSNILLARGKPSETVELATMLAESDYRVTSVYNEEELFERCREESVDLVVLDTSFARQRSVELTRTLVSYTTVALIVVGHDLRPDDRAALLWAGADDCLTLPIQGDELIARIGAVLRRYLGLPGAQARLTVGPFTLDRLSHRLWHANRSEPIQFTMAEARLLECFMQHPNRPVRRERLLALTTEAAHGPVGKAAAENRKENGHSIETSGAEKPTSRVVDVHIAHIRAKLRRAGIRDLLITALRGAGYVMHVDELSPSRPGIRVATSQASPRKPRSGWQNRPSSR